jgi:hypothetical protein
VPGTFAWSHHSNAICAELRTESFFTSFRFYFYDDSRQLVFFGRFLVIFFHFDLAGLDTFARFKRYTATRKAGDQSHTSGAEVFGIEFVTDMLSDPFAGYQSGGGEGLQVTGDGRLGQIEEGDDLADGAGFGFQHQEDFQPGDIGHRLEGGR